MVDWTRTDIAPSPMPTDLKIIRCQRGFLVTTNKYAEIGTTSDLFAFDRIHDLAAWLVEQFNPLHVVATGQGGAA